MDYFSLGNVYVCVCVVRSKSRRLNKRAVRDMYRPCSYTCGFLSIEPVIVIGHRDDPRLRVQHQRKVFVAENGCVPDTAK